MGGRDRGGREIEVVRGIGVAETQRPDDAGQVVEVADGRSDREIDRDVKIDAVAGQKHRRAEACIGARSGEIAKQSQGGTLAKVMTAPAGAAGSLSLTTIGPT